jgi:hypothetical protein
MYFGFDAANNPYKFIQRCKANVGPYKSSIQATQKLAEKLKAVGTIVEVLFRTSQQDASLSKTCWI